MTAADALAIPPAPLHVRTNALELVSTPLDWLPAVAFVPDQAPEAMQEVASVDDQVSVEDPPLVTAVGFALSDTVGTGGGGGMPDTATAADALAVPPGPLQTRVNVLELANVPVDWLPEVALLPDQAPEATQEVASVDDQVSVEEPPLVTEVGFAPSDTVGTGGVVTATLADAVALPPCPVQIREKLLPAVSAPVD